MEQLFCYQDDDLFLYHIYEQVPNSQDFTMHAHDMYEVFYFISGDGSYFVEGTEYQLEPHDVLIMRNTETHRLFISSDHPYERITIHFSPSILSEIDPDGILLKPFKDHVLGQMNRFRATDFLSEHMHTYFEGLDTVKGTSKEVRLHVFARLLGILTEIYSTFVNMKDLERDITHRDVATKLVAYINQNLFEIASLEHICNAFYLSKSQLIRIFRNATGSTIWDYILIKRLLTARERILSGEPVGQTSITCGFRDYSTFYRSYKARFGCSPKEDVQNYKKQMTRK